MIDDSRIGRMARDILEALDLETQRLIETATPDECKDWQHAFASYLAVATGDPYHDLYRAFGLVIKEIAAKPEGQVHLTLRVQARYFSNHQWRPVRGQKRRKSVAVNDRT